MVTVTGVAMGLVVGVIMMLGKATHEIRGATQHSCFMTVRKSDADEGRVVGLCF